MSTSATVLDYINGLKWPLFAGGVILFLRKPIKDLADRIANSEKGSINAAGASISWESALKEVNDSVKRTIQGGRTPELPQGSSPVVALPPRAPSGVVLGENTPMRTTGASTGVKRESAPPKAEPGSTEPSPYARWIGLSQSLVETMPDKAVGAAYEALEGTLRMRAAASGAENVANLRGSELISKAELQPEIRGAVSKLWALSNSVSYLDVQPTPDEARSFIRSVEMVSKLVDNTLPAP